MSKPSVRVKVDKVQDLHESLRLLAQKEVLVGFPEDTTDREDGEFNEPTNAVLGYIHDNGAPEKNIPARPFMVPGIASVQERITRQLVAGARAAVGQMNPTIVETNLERVGSIAEVGIKRYINSGVPPPLAEATLRERERRGRKGATIELARRAVGAAPSVDFAKPLIDTAQMRNAVRYVIRDRKKRRK